MSDAVALALIGLLKSWGDLFVANLHIIIPAVAAALLGWQNSRNSRKSEQRAREVRHEIDNVKKVAQLSDEQTALIAKGAERQGVEIGIKTERLRASDMQALRAGYNPESTDVFMSKTGDKS